MMVSIEECAQCHLLAQIEELTKENRELKELLAIVEANLITLTISPFSEAGVNFDKKKGTKLVHKMPLKAIKDGRWIR